MIVRNAMTKKLVTITPETSYEGAAQLMHAEGLSALPVVDGTGALVGILTEKDLIRAMYPNYGEYFQEPEAYTDEESREMHIADLRKHPVSKYMTTHILSVGQDTPLMLAGGMMLSHRLHQLPVIEDGKLVGMLSRERLFGRILKHGLGLE